MQNYRRRGTYAVATALTLALMTACGGGDAGTEGAAGATAGAEGDAAEGQLIGLSMRYIAGNSWLSTISDAVVAEGEERGYTVEAADAQGNASTQIQQMQTFINRGAAAIIIEPVGDNNVAAGIAAANEAGVPVVVVNDRVSEELATQVACNVYDDGFETAKGVGAETAAVVSERFDSGSTVNLYIQALFPQELVTQVREEGFMEGWNEHFEANPGIETNRIPNNYGEALPDKTLAAMRNVLAGNPDVNVVFNQTDVVMGAVTEALKDAGLMEADNSSDVIIAGFDGGMDVVTAMAEGDSPVVATGLNQPATQAGYAVEEAIAAITDTPTGECEGSPANRVLPAVVVTPENAEEYVNPDLSFAGEL